MDINEIIDFAYEKGASDIHLTTGIPPVIRVEGDLLDMGIRKLTLEDTERLVRSVLEAEDMLKLEKDGEVDVSYSRPGVGRYRLNAYKQRGAYGMAFRVIPLNIPNMDKLGIPQVVKDLARLPRGLVLVTGPTGSGKTTTLATMIDLINSERRSHILTLEDPIEYLHSHKKSIVNQREIGSDTEDFASSLRASLRQDPDVILVGEMRDLDTISVALTAAETGHLVLSTLHTVGAAKTIDRVIDVFPTNQQQQVRVQLASILQAVVSQQLVPKKDGSGRVGVYEIMIANNGIRSLIRDNKVHQIDSYISTGKAEKMQSMDADLIDLYQRGIIDMETVMSRSIRPNDIEMSLGR